MKYWPIEGLEAVLRCPICASEERSQLYSGLRDFSSVGSPGEWNLWQCMKCGSAFLDPRPSGKAMHLAYEGYHTHVAHPDQSEPVGLLATLRRAVGNGYRNWRYGAQLRPASRTGVMIALVPPLRVSLDVSARYLPRLHKDVSRRVLDVGCGNCSFLWEAQNFGWDVAGCDFDPVVVQAARRRNYNVRLGGIETWGDRPCYFEAITINHVIEHVPDPCGMLRKACDLLKPGGTLFLETPNIEAVGHEIFGRSWRGLEPPRHLILFSKSALFAALRVAGFTNVREVARPNPFFALATESQQIARAEVCPEKVPKVALRVVGRLRSAVASRRSEFITVVASKPADATQSQ